MLSGVTVIDLTRYLPGPYGTLRLADLGAKVIKIEPPEGDPAQNMLVVDDKGVKSSCLYTSQNRDKQSIRLNLKDNNDRALILKMIETADVFIEGFRPGVVTRLGLNYDTLAEINPDLIYCSLSGYGQNSSIAHLGGHDINFVALSGLYSMLTEKDGSPITTEFPFADIMGGFALSESVLAGLVQRSIKRKGGYIDLSITDSMVSIMGLFLMRECLTDKQDKYIPVVSYNIYATKDRRFVSIGAIERKFWDNFCMETGHQEWIQYQRTPSTSENPVFNAIVGLFASKTFKEWELFAKKVDCCMMPVYTPIEMSENEYVQSRGLIKNESNKKHVLSQYKTPVGSNNFCI